MSTFVKTAKFAALAHGVAGLTLPITGNATATAANVAAPNTTKTAEVDVEPTAAQAVANPSGKEDSTAGIDEVAELMEAEHALEKANQDLTAEQKKVMQKKLTGESLSKADEETLAGIPKKVQDAIRDSVAKLNKFRAAVNATVFTEVLREMMATTAGEAILEEAVHEVALSEALRVMNAAADAAAAVEEHHSAEQTTEVEEATPEQQDEKAMPKEKKPEQEVVA